eukprot:GHVS01006960.1.p1 GENE.GHVS01006960.1~~GHVS01006960.1.p1  ORF type:complete len:353 (-),score=32.08 GHVS01006960.1:176-1234(-)
MWASPQFGQMFATCSEDRCVGVWSIADSGDEVSWVNRCKIRDFKRGVTDLRFSPKQYGLYLATGCEDGYVRMYQLQDALEFHSWRLTEQFSLLLPGPSNSSGIASADVGCINAPHQTWQLLQTSDAHQQSKDLACSPRFSRSFDLLCTGGRSPFLIFWCWEFSSADASTLYTHKPVTSAFSSTSSFTSGDSSPPVPLKANSRQSRSFSTHSLTNGRSAAATAHQEQLSVSGVLPRQAPGLYVSNAISRKSVSWRRLMVGRPSRPSIKWSSNVLFKEQQNRRRRQPLFANPLGVGRLLPLQEIDISPSPCCRVSWSPLGTHLMAVSDEKATVWSQDHHDNHWVTTSEWNFSTL